MTDLQERSGKGSRGFENISLALTKITKAINDLSGRVRKLESLPTSRRGGVEAPTAVINGSWISVDDVNGIRINKDSTPTILGQWDIDGNFAVGINIGAYIGDKPATTNFVIFNESMTYNSEAGVFAAGDLLLGDNSANKANMFWDKSAGILYFRSGTSAKCYINTTGAFTAGGGVVKIDDNGIAITPGSGNPNTIRWLTAGGIAYGLIKTYADTNDIKLIVQSRGDNTAITDVSILSLESADEDGTVQALIQMFAAKDSTPKSGITVWSKQGDITLKTLSTGHVVVTYDERIGTGLRVGDSLGNTYDNDVVIDGGVWLGRDADPTSGNLGYTGNLISYKNTAEEAVYAMKYLAQPMKSTSWDGDSFSSTADKSSTIDLSTFSDGSNNVPAGIKAALLYVGIRDSGSDANDCYIVFGPTSDANEGMFIDCSGLANDKLERNCIIVPCDANGDVYYQIAASGASTMDVWVEVWGYAI